MLTQLYIKNFTLIDELDIPLFPGFSVITGETGAGKSIILGAIGLLLGNRADAKMIKNGCDRCIIEAHFNLSRYSMKQYFLDNDIDYDPEDCIVRREINSNGKSRAFINDTPVSLAIMKELGGHLVDIHSQHQNLLLDKEDFQLNVVDIIANDNKQLDDFKETYKQNISAIKQLEDLKDNISKNQANEDFMRFQFKELNDAQLVDGEQERLEQDTEALNHAEEIKGAVFESGQLLAEEDSGIVNRIKTATSLLYNIEKVYPDIKEISSRLESSYIEIKDISQELSLLSENIDFDPQRLEQYNSRLDLIYTLQHKFHVESVAELINIREKLKEDLNQIDNSDEELKSVERKVAEIKAVCEKKASTLHDMRFHSAKSIEKEMLLNLVNLGLPNVRFQVQFSDKSLSPTGNDKITFLFSANKSTSLLPISQVASGGEIARVMLSLKAMISGAVKLPTIIFDEIDTGVSGRAAEQMAMIMEKMGNNNRQVISITHLPQIAAMGKTHYKVSKEETAQGTISRMYQLTDDDRIQEIAQMLSGSNITEAAISNAKSLLKIRKMNT